MNGDACFYVNENNWETVWGDSNLSYYVIRNGEMKMWGFMRGESEGNGTPIRYTSDLIRYGITADKELLSAIDGGLIVVDDNPWFEVVAVDDDTTEWVVDDLDNGIEMCRELHFRYADKGG